MFRAASSTTLIALGTRQFSVAALILLGFAVGVAVAIFVYKWGLGLLWHSDGTTNWLGRHWSWYDQRTYSPWRGYNRLHSRKWNMDHMQ